MSTETKTDMRWTLDPLPQLELLPPADLMALDPGDLLEYAFDLQWTLESIRTVLHASLTALHGAHLQSLRYQQRIRDLVTALQDAREARHALAAELRARDETRG